MTTQGRNMPDVARYFLITPLIIFTTTVVFCLPPTHGVEVVFYKDVNFTGPVLHNFTVSAKIVTNEGCFSDYQFCLELDQSKGQALSLKTSDSIIVMDFPHCNCLLNNKHDHEKGHSLEIWPGEYPDLQKYLEDAHFPCRVLSFAPYHNFEWRNVTLPDILLRDNKRLGLVAEVKNPCGCVDLPQSAYGRVGAVQMVFICLNLFSEPRCQGKSVKIPAGTTAASEDLRRVSFKGVTKSLSLCKETPCDVGEESSMWLQIQNETGWYDIQVPLSLDTEEENSKTMNLAEPTLLNDNSPVNATCINSMNFTCSATCGGVLHTVNGAIQYKLGEALESFERCVWIIKSPTTWARFNLTQVWRGFKSITGKQEVIISEYPLNPENEDWEISRDFDLSRLSVNETTQYVTVNGPIIIITLYTNELKHENSGGLMLEYTLVQRWDNPLSEYSSDFRMDYGERLCYPLAAQNAGMKNQEISTFLFLPNNHKDGLKSGLKEFVTDTEVSPGVDGCCNAIFMYEFSGYRWQWLPRFKYRQNSYWEDHERKKSIGHDDMVLIMLQSNAALPKGGFCMNSSVQNYPVCENSEGVAESEVVKIE